MNEVTIYKDNPLFPFAEYTSKLEKEVTDLREDITVRDDTIRDLSDVINELTANQRPRMLDGLLQSAYYYMWQKIPYVFGGTLERNKSFDCSSFMQQIYGENGITLPRTSRDQEKRGKAVKVPELGDLLFFDTNKDGVVNHVGMCLGGDYMLHTARTGEDINITNWKDRYGNSFVSAKRVI